MMYDRNTQFVIAILHQGKVLREVKDNVYLPFDSEYSIRIKNPHSYRVCFEVLIDGTSITEHKIILPERSSFDLERMVVDGDLTKGPRLKFISKDGGNCGEEVADPTSNLNGLVEVRIFNETNHSFSRYRRQRRTRCSPAFHQDSFLYSRGIDHDCIAKPNNIHSANYSASSTPPMAKCSSSLTSTNCSLNNPSMDWMQTEQSRGVATSQIGGTVAGQETTQKFELNNDFESETMPFSVLRIWLRGKKEPVLVQDTRHCFCTRCGNKVRSQDRFCNKCGTRIVPLSVR